MPRRAPAGHHGARDRGADALPTHLRSDPERFAFCFDAEGLGPDRSPRARPSLAGGTPAAKAVDQMSDGTNKAVFLSYASQDAEAARRICEALRAAGIEVWFDQSELTGGDAWDAKIRGQIG